jgi:nucleotide-binding universal stress UspA family protein
MIRDVVVKLTDGASRDFAADYALSIAKTFETHLTAIGFAYYPEIGVPMPDVFAPELFDRYRAQAQARAQSAIDQFEELMRREGISGQSRVLTTPPAQAGGMFGPLARRFDVAVVGQPRPSEPAPQHLILEAALFQTGRPVVVVPYIHTSGLTLDRVMVCWDGSSTAARAIGDAIPFLERAGSVDVVIASNEPLKSEEIAGADIAEHLARHRLQVNVRRIGTAGMPVADTLLSAAADGSTDFVVMGGYGHSRMRELILGGTTRAVLESMTVPVLMSH